MAQRTASGVPDEGDERTALIRAWFAEHGDVLRGALALRELGEAGRRASVVVLSVPAVRRFAVSVALIDSMARSDGEDPVCLLAATFDDESLQVVKRIGTMVGVSCLEMVRSSEVRRG